MECILCFDTIEIFARYSCDHVVCHKCAVKLIYLYEDRRCPLCKAISKKTRFEKSNEISMNSNGVKGKNKKVIEDEYGYFDSEFVFKKIKGLLLKKCKKCKEIFSSNKEMLEHNRLKHGELFCDVCVNYGHEFWYEHCSYKPEKLIKHKRGELLEPGFMGHILCPHCEIYLYNFEKAKEHGQKKHHICTVCDVLGIKNQFYKDYESLEKHYSANHFICKDPVCFKNLCYVFAHKSELWAHYLLKHKMETNLFDIKSGLNENPVVFSVKTISEQINRKKNTNIVATPFSAKTMNKQINKETKRNSNIVVTPFVNKPYFAEFNESNKIIDNVKINSNSSGSNGKYSFNSNSYKKAINNTTNNTNGNNNLSLNIPTYKKAINNTTNNTNGNNNLSSNIPTYKKATNNITNNTNGNNNLSLNIPTYKKATNNTNGNNNLSSNIPTYINRNNTEIENSNFKEISNIPEYMNRSIVQQEDHINRNRIKQLELLTKSKFAGEINLSIQKYLDGVKTLDTMVKEIEICVGNKTCLNILNNIKFYHRSTEIKDFLVGYKRSVMFPKFENRENNISEIKNIRKNSNFINSFKILDLSAKRKK